MSEQTRPAPFPGGTPDLTVPAERLLQDWKEAHARAVAYAAALDVPAQQREPLAREAIVRALASPHWEPDADAVGETLAAVRALAVERAPAAARRLAPGLDAFAAWCLERWDGVVRSMPRLARRRMVPETIERRFLRRIFGRLRGGRSGIERHRGLREVRRRLPWIGAAHRRRLLLAVLVLIPTVIASAFMATVLPRQAQTWLELAIVVFFGALFGWISIGFWTAMLGFFMLASRRDRWAVTRLDRAEGPIDPAARTAVVMPICDEPVERVFAGLRAIYRSLERTGQLAHFDFFVLSDSGDPGTWVREEEAWADWCREVRGFDRIFYRRRRVRVRRKSGNVADFCRRWGAGYRYAIMLDADSVMAGETMVRLVRMMEQRHDVGMIQTAPTAVNRRSLFARVQQFSSRLYGPMFAAGLHFWQLGDGQYWGHNTILRVRAFMDHCALPRLPGGPPLGGEILSHDFVEAALMGRAGWTLWLAYDLGGSWEEVPSTLLEEMKRDRRWCQGNLQHLRLLFTEGLFGAHRMLFLNGVLSYVSALLWFAFLTLSTAEAVRDVLWAPEYFPHGASLFPDWPIWRPDWAISLMGVTAVILFLPKLLSVLMVVVRGETRAFGGFFRLLASVLLEILLSSLLAPIRMVFHSRFVVQNLLGRTVTWRSQGREDASTSWGEAIRHHGADTLFASAWGVGLYVLNPDYFWWLTPIIGALILSIPVSVYASRVRPGDRARAAGLFLIPEEAAPPPELGDLADDLREAEQRREALPRAERDGFVRAMVDPRVNALHRVLLRGRRSLRPSIRAAREALARRARADGPGARGARARRTLRGDPDQVSGLHRRVWELPEHERAARWGRPASGA